MINKINNLRDIPKYLLGFLSIGFGFFIILASILSFNSSNRGLTEHIVRNNFYGMITTIIISTIPIIIGVVIVKCKQLLSFTGWTLILVGIWLTLSSLGPTGPLNYMRFGFIRLDVLGLFLIGAVHLMAGYGVIKRKKWSHTIAILLFLVWIFSIITFFCNFMYTQNDLKAIIKHSLYLGGPIFLLLLYLLGSKKDFS